MIGNIVGGCIAVYIVAFLLRWLVKLYTKVSGREYASYKVRYTTIGIATIIASVLSAFGEGGFNSPDFSYWWVFLISGLIIFAGSLGYSYKKWKEAQEQAPEHTEELSTSEGIGKSPANEWATVTREEEGGLWWLYAVLVVVIAVVPANSSGMSAEDAAGLVVGGIIGTIMWLGEGFLTAITNPYYIGGLIIGIGTGWILRGAAKT